MALCANASGLRASPTGRPWQTGGFTLIEMLVVMVLMGLLSALALPAMQRWHDAVQVRAQAAVVLDALRAAAFAAGASRRDIVMDESSFASAVAAPAAAASNPTEGRRELAVVLPLGWMLKRVVPATFLSNGLCRPGLVALQTERGETVMVQVHGPLCAVELMPAGATS